MGVKVLDRFTRADSTSALGSAESGQAWTATTGTWGVLGGRAYPSAVPTNSNLFGNAALAVVDAGEAVQSVWATIAVDCAIGHLSGVVARMTDINNYWFAFLYKSNTSPNNTFLYAGKIVANSNTYSIANTIQMPAGLLFPATIGLTVDSGNVWRAYCNGVQLGSAVTDSFNSTATKVGVWQENMTDARLDDFLVFTPNGSFLSAESKGARSPYAREVIGLSPDAYWPMDDVTAVIDKFDRGADSATSLGSADTGQPWRQDHGTWGTSGGKAYTSVNDTAGSQGGLASADLGNPQQDVSVVLATLQAAGEQFGVIARMTDANNYWLAALYRSLVGGNPLQLFFGKCVAGTFAWTVNALDVTGASFPATLEITASAANLLTVILNGVSKGSVTDAFNSGATRVGIHEYNSTAQRIESISAVPIPIASLVPDRSGNGLDLVVAGSPTLGAADVLPGGASSSISGWLNTKRLTRNTASAFDVGTGDFTLMFWGNFDPTVVGGQPWAMVPFAYDSLNAASNGMVADGFLVYLLTTGFNAVRVYVAGSSADYTGAGAPGIDNATHCFIVERVSGVVTVYIDNVSAGSSTLSGNASPASSGTGRRVVIGGDVGNTTFNYYTQGRQAHTAFWKRALTAAERSLLHGAGRRMGVSV